jgi:hypothetical protein
MKTALDIVIAPKEAFESLKANPTWGWALLIAFLLMLVGYFLEQPAAQHASYGSMQHAISTNPLYSGLSDEQKQRVLNQVAHPPAYQTLWAVVSLLLVLFIATLLNAVILLAGSAIARGSGDFKHLFAGSMNIAVPTIGLYTLVLGIICRALGPDHFATMSDVYRVVPGLALLTPGVTGSVGAFLAGIQIFSLWGLGLNIGMMRVMAGVRNAIAWVFPLFILLAGALLQAGVNKFYG